ncbi:MAG: hypothetical protein RIQ52_1049, partial [Pseudomonadota bacterium]
FAGSDRLDLRALDADAIRSGNQRFHFIGTHDFTGHAGEVRFSSADHLLSADVNGDQTADFAVILAGVSSMTSSKIML